MKRTMKKSKILTVGLIMVGGLILAGCADFAQAYSKAYNSGTNASTNNSTEGRTYTFVNHSSYSVDIWDNTGRVTIRIGGSASTRFNKDVSVFDVKYSPADKVRISQNGTTVYFYDK